MILWIPIITGLMGCHDASKEPRFVYTDQTGDTEGTDTARLPDEPMGECPTDMILIEGGAFEVGAPPELAEQDDKSRIPLGDVTLGDYCISTLPFPGLGHAWPTGGLNGDLIADLDTLFRNTGRHVATGSEYLVATATASNDRWPDGASSWAEADCDPNQDDPGRIGDFPACTSAWGVGGLLTFSFWVGNDDQFSVMLLKSQISGWAEADWIVVGGTPTVLDTFYGDDLYGVHGHEEGADRYRDDNGLFLVAAPNAVSSQQEASYLDIVEAFEASDGDWASVDGG